MKRIHTMELEHFKAFEETASIELGGRNLLLYGPNGSEKSSIFWALHTFLQSSQKSQEEVQKYFDPSHRESLVNIKKAEDASSSIVLHIGEETDEASVDPVCISLDEHETPVPDLQKANLASDFITYRVLFRFFQFSNNEEIDLWPVFSSEILPFCSASLGENLADMWGAFSQEDPYQEAKRKGFTGRAAGNLYDWYGMRLRSFNTGLEGSLDSIQKAAQVFYDDHFAHKEEEPLKIALHLTQSPEYDRKKHRLIVPKIGLKITLGSDLLYRPQSFLNEAKLTQIALSIRFGATKANLQDAPMKLLVLDDLLISLDMSNRMQVIKVILSDDDFDDYQKIIMTHDRGFYNEIRRKIGSDHGQWAFKEIYCPNGGAPEIKRHKDDLQQAKEYLDQNRLDNAAVALRKAAEASLKRFGEVKLGMVFEKGKFKSLSDNLKAAKKRMEADSVRKLSKLLKTEDIDETTVAQLIAIDDEVISARSALDEPSRGKLKSAGRQLTSLLQEIMKVNREALDILQQIDETTDRILNPGSHAGDPVLYSAEVESALALIQRLSALADE